VNQPARRPRCRPGWNLESTTYTIIGGNYVIDFDIGIYVSSTSNNTASLFQMTYAARNGT